MKKKRIFAFLLTIIMLAGFCGCSASAKGLISQRRLDDMLAKGETFWAEQKTHELGETITVTDYVRPLSYVLQYPKTGFPETDARIETIVSDMVEVRKLADLLEKLTASSYWPYPIYSDILYY